MPKKYLMFYRRLIILLLMFIASEAWAQAPVRVTGKVTSSDDGSQLPGVNVVEKGTSNGTVTNSDGTYTIEVNQGSTLVFSFVGYAPSEIVVGNESVVDVVLDLDILSLSEVVVIGYGTAEKSDVTGAVAKVTSKDFNQGSITNPFQQVQGKIAGLVITAPTGDPNDNPSIRLRGQTSLSGGQSPLIVVDGIPLENVNQLSNIPAGDIASYDVLKDASATSIYGSRGANGVIIITTKKGKSGSPKLEYSGFASVDKQPKFLDLLSGDEWRAANPAGVGSVYDNGANTDWQEEVIRNASTHSHTVSLSGGTEKFSYRSAVNYLNQEGIVVNSGKEQLGLRFNMQQKALSDRLSLNMGISFSQTDRKYVAGWTQERLRSTSPALSVYKPDGSFNDFSFGLGEQNALQGAEKTVNLAREFLTQISSSADYEVVKGLKLGTTGSITYFTSNGRYFLPVNIEGNALNRASRNTSNRDFYRGDLHANYAREWGKHYADATAVYEYNLFSNDGFSAGGQNFNIPVFQENNLGTGEPAYRSVSSGREEYKIISYLGRINYNFDSKYYLTASLRRDGSSKFGVNNRWGLFPAVTVAWRLSEESFLAESSVVSDLKIRMGYGVTGNSDAISPYASFLTYAPLPNPVYDPVTGTFITAYAPSQNPNPDLEWEKRIGRNIGLDFGFLDNRLTGDLNFFSDRTENLLFNYLLPSPPFFILPPYSVGNIAEGAYVLANVGSLTNKGVELGLDFKAINSKNFSWTVGGQISTVRTEITRLSGQFAGFNIPDTTAAAGYAGSANGSTIATTYLKAGYSPYVFYIPHFAGLNENGEQLFTSLVDDGSGNMVEQNFTLAENPDPDRRYINAAPKFNFGLTNRFTYKNWAFSFFLRGVIGQKAYNNSLSLLESGSALRLSKGYNVTRDALTNGITDGQAVSDRWLENASFVRLDNASLSYNFTRLPGIQSLNLFVATNNLFVITKYKGLDPEIQVADTNSAYISDDNRTPKTRSFTIGVNVSFN